MRSEMEYRLIALIELLVKKGYLNEEILEQKDEIIEELLSKEHS